MTAIIQYASQKTRARRDIQNPALRAFFLGPLSRNRLWPRDSQPELSEIPGTVHTQVQVNGIGSSYSTSSARYRPTIYLSGRGFNAITRITRTCAMPNGGLPCTGSPYTWTSTNWSSKFSVSNDNSATISPTLVTGPTDPKGIYGWAVTFATAIGQSTIQSFVVTYR
jgi:hypothetical protein